MEPGGTLPVAFGASLNQFTTGHGRLLDGKLVVQINLEQTEIGRHVTPDVGIVGDPALTADLFVHWLDEAEIPPSRFRTAELKNALAGEEIDQSLYRDGDDTIDVRKALVRLSRALPKERIVVTDGGRFIGEAWKTISATDPRSFIVTHNFGSIGLGMGHAIGAYAAGSGRPVVLIVGDGGFMLGGLTEFNTAVRHGVDLIVLMCDDGSYGAEHVQLRRKQMDPGITLFDWPDFAPVIRALGGDAVTVRNESDLEKALGAIPGRTRPLFIDLKVDPDKIPPLDL